MNAEDLEHIEQMVEDQSSDAESVLHKAMKKWIAIEYYNKGVSVDQIEIEKKISIGSYSSTTPDVFINYKGGVAIYCQTRNEYTWLYKFLEKQLETLKKHSKKQIVIFPENLEALSPARWHHCVKELGKENVRVVSAPFDVPVKNKQDIQINISYKALAILIKLRNEYYPNKTLTEFIECDLERIVKDGEGFP